MIDIKKERKKIVKDLRYGEKIGALSHKEGKKILRKFDNNCKENKNKFDKKKFKRNKIFLS